MKMVLLNVNSCNVIQCLDFLISEIRVHQMCVALPFILNDDCNKEIDFFEIDFLDSTYYKCKSIFDFVRKLIS